MRPKKPGQTATTAKPLSLKKAKAALKRLVAEGKVRPSALKLIDIRELTERERAIGKAVGREWANRKRLMELAREFAEESFEIVMEVVMEQIKARTAQPPPRPQAHAIGQGGESHI